MMIDRLARALEHVEELPPEAQEELAEQIEEQIEAFRLPASPASGHLPTHRSFAGIWRDLPDDMEETLLRWRREATPTPPLEDQLRWADEESDEASGGETNEA